MGEHIDICNISNPPLTHLWLRIVVTHIGRSGRRKTQLVGESSVRAFYKRKSVIRITYFLNLQTFVRLSKCPPH